MPYMYLNVFTIFFILNIAQFYYNFKWMKFDTK